MQIPGIRECITNMNPDYYFQFAVDFIGSNLNQLYSYVPPVNIQMHSTTEQYYRFWHTHTTHTHTPTHTHTYIYIYTTAHTCVYNFISHDNIRRY
jgi:hypothetical protein